MNKLASFGAMFQLIHPFPQCNELTLINLYKMATDLLLTNTEQLDFNSLVFEDKNNVATPLLSRMIEALFNARRFNGELPSHAQYSPTRTSLEPQDDMDEDSGDPALKRSDTIRRGERKL